MKNISEYRLIEGDMLTDQMVFFFFEIIKINQNGQLRQVLYIV